MAEGVFLDTFGLIALLNRDDEYHRSAATAFGRIGEAGRTVVTTNLVLGELGNGLARTPLRAEVGWLIGQLHTDPASTVVHVDRKTFADGVDLYVKRGDKFWGSVRLRELRDYARNGASGRLHSRSSFSAGWAELSAVTGR